MGKVMHFPWGRRHHWMGILWNKVPILWGKYGYQFHRLSQFDGLRWIFQCYWKLMGKPKHFSYDEFYYRMEIWLEKCTNIMGKVWVPISQAFPWVLLHFPVLWKIDGDTHAFIICWSIPQDGNLMEKSIHTMEKIFPRLFPFDGFCWIFPCYWKLIRKPIRFPCNEEYHRIGI